MQRPPSDVMKAVTTRSYSGPGCSSTTWLGLGLELELGLGLGLRLRLRLRLGLGFRLADRSFVRIDSARPALRHPHRRLCIG